MRCFASSLSVAAMVLALASAAAADEPAPPPKPAPPPQLMVTLRAWGVDMTEAMQRIVDGVHPADALAVPVEEVVQRREREFRSILRKSKTERAEFDAIEIYLVYPNPDAPLVVATTLHPGATDVAVLALSTDGAEEAARHLTTDAPFTAPLAALGPAIADLHAWLSTDRCATLPVVADAELERIIPAAFLQRATDRVHAVSRSLPETCQILHGREPPFSVAVGRIHFNLYDGDGRVVGGVETRLLDAKPPYQLAFPTLKSLPEP